MQLESEAQDALRKEEDSQSGSPTVTGSPTLSQQVDEGSLAGEASAVKGGRDPVLAGDIERKRVRQLLSVVDGWQDTTIPMRDAGDSRPKKTWMAEVDRRPTRRS